MGWFAGVEEEFDVSFRAGNGGRDGFDDYPTKLGDSRGDFLDGPLLNFGVANDATLANVASACFKLRLNEDHCFCEHRSCGNDRPQEKRSGDKGDIHHKQGEGGHAGFRKGGGRKKTGIGALDQPNPRIVAELHRYLPESGIHGSDVGGAVLKKTVSKPTGGGPDVEAGAARELNVPVVERPLEFEAATTHVWHVLAEKANGGVWGNRCAGFVDLLLVDQDPTGQDESTSSLATLGEIAIDQQNVNAAFTHGRQERLQLLSRLDRRIPGIGA